MKNTIFLCLIFLFICIMLTSCGDAVSMGIIGCHDGPTAVFVSKEGEKQKRGDEVKLRLKVLQCLAIQI